MPLDRAGTQEHARGDFGIGQPVSCEPGDLGLLRREQTGGLCGSGAYLLSDRCEFTGGAVGEGPHPHPDEQFVGGSQLIACVAASILTTQPFAVEQTGAREFAANPRGRQEFDGLAILGFGLCALTVLVACAHGMEGRPRQRLLRWTIITVAFTIALLLLSVFAGPDGYHVEDPQWPLQ